MIEIGPGFNDRAAINHQYAFGFEDDLIEVSSEPLNVTGIVPDWLTGYMIKNGPAKFRVGDRSLAHWFDGFAKLHKFEFETGKIQYSCRFIQSRAYSTANVSGKLSRSEFATSPEFGLLEKLKALVAPPLTDNTNVNVIRMGNQWLALTETSNIIEFLPDSLATVGSFRFGDAFNAPITTAHPVIDPKTGGIFNLHVEISLKHHYVISYWQPAMKKDGRRVLARMPVKNPAYVHSFAQTEQFIIIVESPLRLSAADLILGTKPYVKCYQWHDHMGTRFLVVSKQDGSYFVCDYENRFFFHQVNAFESGDVIELDLLTYPDATILDSLRLENLRTGGKVPISQPERIQINLKTKEVRGAYLDSCGMELPRINHRGFDCRRYRFVYGAGASSSTSFFDSLVKLDSEAGSHIKWSRPNCYYSEPLFVPRTGGEVEDDGVLLCIELDGRQKRSRLIIVDARSMQLMAETPTSNTVPFGFHACYSQWRN
jgi:carotenoid cleavage dioxygenase-like enzyme